MISNEMTPQDIIMEINQYFKKAIVVTDVGQNQLWTTQFLELDENKQLLTSGGMGTMGHGFPAAIGAQLGNPDKTVLAITGDGGFQMNLQEMATATAYELPVIICIFNNGCLGNVRQWQEIFFHKRYSSTCLQFRKSCNRLCHDETPNCPKGLPDYQILAQCYEAMGILVTKKEEIKGAFQTAENNKKGPTIIEFLIQKEDNVLPIVAPGIPLDQMLLTL